MNLCTWYFQADQRRKRLEGLEAYPLQCYNWLRLAGITATRLGTIQPFTLEGCSCLGTAALRSEGTVDEGDCLAGEVCLRL